MFSTTHQNFCSVICPQAYSLYFFWWMVLLHVVGRKGRETPLFSDAMRQGTGVPIPAVILIRILMVLMMIMMKP